MVGQKARGVSVTEVEEQTQRVLFDGREEEEVAGRLLSVRVCECVFGCACVVKAGKQEAACS